MSLTNEFVALPVKIGATSAIGASISFPILPNRVSLTLFIATTQTHWATFARRKSDPLAFN